MKKRKNPKECLYNSISATTPEGCNSIISRVLSAMNSDKNSHSNTGTPSRHPEAITRHPEATTRHSERSEESKKRLKQESKKHSYCHPEEQRELRILPIMEDNKEHWSDSEHTRLSQSRKDDSFRMTNNTPSPAGEGRGEGWQNQNHVNDNNKINCHPEFTSRHSEAQAVVTFVPSE